MSIAVHMRSKSHPYSKIRSYLKTVLALLLASALTISLMGCSIDSSRGWIGSSPQVTQRELLSQIESDTAPVILDVRTPEEYAAGHVPGAINIHFQEIESRLDEIVVPNEDSIVIYCERGIRANKAEDALYAAGFESVFHLAGDMSNWRRNGLLIEQED